MKLTRKQKKLLKSTLYISGFVLLIIFFLQLTKTPNTVFDGCFNGQNGEPMCMTMYEDGSASQIQQLAIAVNPGLPTSGEDISIEMILSIPYSTTITASNLQLKKGNTIIESWDLKDKLPFGGGSFYTIINTRAPMTEGSYELYFYVLQSDTSDRILYEETESFTVGGVDCPSDDCTSYSLLKNVDNGNLYSRECSSFGSPPGCFEDVNIEYKLDCDSGYIVEQTDNNVYVSDTLIGRTCEIEQQDEVVNCYACDGGSVVTIPQKNICESPLETNRDDLNCESSTVPGDEQGTGNETGLTDEETNIVVCKGYEIEKEGVCSVDIAKAITDKEFYKDYMVWVVGVAGVLLLLIAYLYTQSQKRNRTVF